MPYCFPKNVFSLVLVLSGLSAPLPFAAAAEALAASTPNEAATSDPVELINEKIRQGWASQDFRPSRSATASEWCRRVYLDVVGRIPTVEEIESFLRDRSPQQKVNLVDKLLSSEYSSDYTHNWSNIWANVLIGRTGGTTRQSLANRAGMFDYLRECFEGDKPYDDFVRELITASGSCRPGDEDFNGAANFLADKLDENGIQATAKTAQDFLGIAVQCTQCHNHPFNEYRQNQFWELSTFYRQTRVERLPVDEMDNNRFVARVYEQDFAGEGKRRHWRSSDEIVYEQVDGKLVDTGAQQRAAAPVFYELRNGKVKMAYPVFVDGTSLESLYEAEGSEFGNSGYLEHVNRRQELANLVIASEEFEQAVVNRYWAHFFGHGFTKPFDDMGPHNPPSHPELLTSLGKELRNASFDLKLLIRWIVLSEPYELSSRVTRANEKDDPTIGARPMFTHFYLRQMEAEQLYDSLLVATGADGALSEEERETTRQRWLDQFNTAFGNDENTEATSFNGSIPQALMLMNGPLTRKATSAEKGSFLTEVAENTQLSKADKIRTLYLAALSRQPSRDEIGISNQLLAARDGDVSAALQDIWWAILNSNEFILIH